MHSDVWKKRLYVWGVQHHQRDKLNTFVPDGVKYIDITQGHTGTYGICTYTHIHTNVRAHMGACTDELQKQPPWETVNSPNHRVHRRVRGAMGKQGACVRAVHCHQVSQTGDGRRKEKKEDGSGIIHSDAHWRCPTVQRARE